MTEPQDEEFPADPPSGPSTSVIIFGVIGVVAILALGFIGYASGTGWFGYRSFLYGEGDLYIGNYTLKERAVSIDGREPVSLDPQTYEILRLVGGTSQIHVRDADGKTVDRFAITIDRSDAFAKIADEPTCLAAANVSSFYGGIGSGELEFDDLIEADQKTYVPGSLNVIWPGNKFPKNLQPGAGPGIWLEKVGCALLDERSMMEAYLKIRLDERMKREPKAPTRRR